MKYKNTISFLILFLLLSVICFSQSIVNRANSSYTVQDARFSAQYNLFVPKYADSVAANLQKGIDTCGAIIYLYSTHTVWYRSCASGVKAWVEIGSGGGDSVTPDTANTYTGVRVAAWGNSLTAQLPGWTMQTRKRSGSLVFNGGVGGQTSTQIKTRFLADTTKWDWSVVIWSGRNNFSSLSTVLTDIAEMVSNIPHNRYIVLSVTNAAGEGIGTGPYNEIIALNDTLQDIYGERFFNIREYLVSQYDPDIPQDVIDHADDIPPSSLRSDGVHYNDAGYIIIGNYIFDTTWHILTGRSADNFATSSYSQLGSNPWYSQIENLANYKSVYLNDSLSRPIIVDQYLYWNGSAYAATSGYGLGAFALLNNKGTNANAFGVSSLSGNTGNFANGFGELALNNNTGTNSNGFGYSALRNNTGASSTGVGHNALFGNTGASSTGIGSGALQNNIGANSTAVGVSALQSNTGGNSTAVGVSALFSNTGTNSVAVGLSSGQSNTGTFVTFVGTSSGLSNTGGSATGIGSDVLRSNTGANAFAGGYQNLYLNTGANATSGGYQGLFQNVSAMPTAFGYNAAKWNNWPNRIVIGGDNAPVFTASSVKNFASADVNATTDAITITAHGFGTTGQKVNLIYNLLTGTTVGGLTNNVVYQGTITDANTITISGITSAGAGTYTLSKDVDKTGSIFVGINGYNTKSNQAILGGSNITETLLRGSTGINGITPTAYLHLPAGTAAASTAPLKFTSGTNLTTPEAGAVEFDGTNYFVTSSTTRYTLAKTLTNTASLDFASTGAGAVADLTITVTGAADGDAVTLGVPNGSVTATATYSAWVSAANTVTVRFSPKATEDPASGTFRVIVIKY